jgi:hypothetical protein
MKLRQYISIILFFITITSCNQNQSIPAVNLEHALPKDTVQIIIDSLKSVCQPGDLIVRLGNDLISDQIRFLSEKDHYYSHVGMIVNHNGKKMVCNISPGDFTNSADTIRYEIIDSFINPKNNLACALYRYDITDIEKIKLQAQLDSYHNQKIHFDKIYDLKTDNKLYCSEMIYKALKKVTNDRIEISQSYIPANMHHLISLFFKKFNIDSATIVNRKIIAIDNLYDNLHCRLIMKFTLKKMP